MAKKTAGKKTIPPRAKKLTRSVAAEAALILAGEKGWPQVGLSDVAARLKTNPADLMDVIEDREDLLVAFGRMIDRRVIESIGMADQDIPPRDRLFDILMERFDALEPYRPGVLSVLESHRGDPKQMMIGLPHLCRSMSWMLDCAGFETSGWAGALRVAGLSAVYLKTVRVWTADDTADLSKTMAELDKNLAFIDKAAAHLRL